MSDATFFTIAPKTGAKVTGSSPTFKIRRGSAESTQKGGTSYFGVAATFARKEPCLGFIPSSRQVQEDNRRVSSRPALGTLGMHHTLLMGSGFGTNQSMQRKANEDKDFGLQRRVRNYRGVLHRDVTQKKRCGIRIPTDLVSVQEEREGRNEVN
ncbi:hypothetical protein PIB30_042495 [Stylosanthes scabra]|uniref:Uncharacterized protein n=1 Tax=Stylosanthes scabra TaxID=79078 RepID=A0ABU6ZE11_9FABA|nr:hypothetical protein [Stylosanthes scabra]